MITAHLSQQPLVEAIDLGHVNTLSLMLEREPSLIDSLDIAIVLDAVIGAGYEELAGFLLSIIEQQSLHAHTPAATGALGPSSRL